ncbi:MAG: tetratricopeptide repeat protein, partial [Candidatus Rokuibacteriota bacterium]
MLLLAYQRSRGTPHFQMGGSEGESRPVLADDLPPETEAQVRLRDNAEELLAGFEGAVEKGELLRGLLAMGRGEFPQAAEHLSKYTQIEPWDASARRLEAISWYYAGRPDRAGEELDRLLATSPDAYAYLWRGIVHLRTRQYEAAFSDSTRAIQLDGNLAWAYRNRARAKRSLGDVDGALADLGHALDKDPESFMTYGDRAVVRSFYRGDYEGALSDANRAVELNPTSGYARMIRAFVRMEQGDLDGVASDAAAAVEADPRRDFAL